MTPLALRASSEVPMSVSRRIVHRTRGRGHGPIVRLMSPSDIGGLVKPFVFLDLFEADMGQMQRSMQLHPHSGIATVTVFTKGDVSFDDPAAGEGTLAYGGVEWMRAGGGVWHGKELGRGASATVQGFQLWVTLPPELENGPSESQYVEAKDIQSVGPAHVVVGAYEGVQSPVRAPAGLNYLMVTLKPGQKWTYQPPAGQSVAWVAVAQGTLMAGEVVSTGEMAVFEDGVTQIEMVGHGSDDTIFVLGSAVPHDHVLHLGAYSVHTTAQALEAGEQRIVALRKKLLEAGDRRTKSGSIPAF